MALLTYRWTAKDGNQRTVELTGIDSQHIDIPGKHDSALMKSTVTMRRFLKAGINAGIVSSSDVNNGFVFVTVDRSRKSTRGSVSVETYTEKFIFELIPSDEYRPHDSALEDTEDDGNGIDLTPYFPDFRAIALAHIKAKLMPSNQWAYFRRYAATNPSFDPAIVVNPNATASELLESEVCEDSSTLTEILMPFSNYEVVGKIEGEPVYYIHDEGIYVWALAPDEPVCISFWCTTPAYPPST